MGSCLAAANPDCRDTARQGTSCDRECRRCFRRGGIPVIDGETGLRGVAAVIDKDRSAAILAGDVDADMLVILTAVDRVCLDYNTPECREIDVMTVSEARRYAAAGQFAEGSMLPKVEACINFVENRPQARALITSLRRASEALLGETGTLIVADGSAPNERS
ncbi:hypothetical protein [Actinobaculum sp. 313]|uniref:amino acid kinase family protein n=1 Tax=Actinobaculum sp. 313 TaxID=2495645 RepID=UPI0023E7A58C|nr:hypothetical protein [Actinobaculum sp. 313]